MAAYGGLVTLYASLPVNDAGNDTSPHRAERDGYLADLADRFALMALFAEVVYRRDLAEADRDGQGCAYLAAGPADPAVPDFGMPHGSPADGRWRRWVPAADLPAVHACVDADGLYYETYVHEDAAGRLDDAVIAFRGTENRPGQVLADWTTNIVAALGIEPAQYALARERLPPLIDALVARFGRDGHPPRIVAVGHSLGGGLAQQAGYLSADIAEVYTFNTSPVTNWSRLRIDQAIATAYPTIYRVYHGGEILEKLRFVTTSLTTARYGRHDIGLQFVGRNSFAGHDMQVITCSLAAVLAGPGGNRRAHHYPTGYIRSAVLPPEGAAGPDAAARICQRGT